MGCLSFQTAFFFLLLSGEDISMKMLKYFFAEIQEQIAHLIVYAVAFTSIYGVIALLGKYIYPSSICEGMVFYHSTCFLSGIALVLKTLIWFLAACFIFLIMEKKKDKMVTRTLFKKSRPVFNKFIFENKNSVNATFICTHCAVITSVGSSLFPRFAEPSGYLLVDAVKLTIYMFALAIGMCINELVDFRVNLKRITDYINGNYAYSDVLQECVEKEPTIERALIEFDQRIRKIKNKIRMTKFSCSKSFSGRIWL